MLRLGAADQEGVGDALNKEAEASVQIDVVRDENSPRSQSAPSPILSSKTRVVFGVYNIIDKEVDLRERRE